MMTADQLKSRFNLNHALLSVDVLNLIQTLNNIIENLESSYADIESENKALRIEISQLKKRLNQDSTNSSRPPSSDGLKKRTSSLRPKGKNKSGG